MIVQRVCRPQHKFAMATCGQADQPAPVEVGIVADIGEILGCGDVLIPVTISDHHNVGGVAAGKHMMLEDPADSTVGYATLVVCTRFSVLNRYVGIVV